MNIAAYLVKTYKTLHTWVGIVAGLFLFICFFAGSVLMFQEPLMRWASPPPPVAVSAMPSEQWQTLINKTLAAYPQAQKNFTFHTQLNEATPTHLSFDINAKRGGRFAEDDGYPPTSQLRWVYLDNQGNLQGFDYQPSHIGTLINDLHQTAGIPVGRVGHDFLGVYVMGVVAVLYFLALVSGTIVLLPTLVKDFFAVRVGKNLKRFWLDTHNVLGITSLPFHIVIAFTTVVFAFHDIIYDNIEHLAYNDKPIFNRPEKQPPQPANLAQLMTVDKITQLASEQSAGFVPRELEYSNVMDKNASVMIWGENDHYIQRAATRNLMRLNPYTGKITDSEYLAGKQRTDLGVITSFFSLHFGSFGGNVVRWLYFILGLMGAALFYTGNLLWLESRRKKLKSQVINTVSQNKSVKIMAALTVGVSIGCMAGMGWAMSMGKWLSPIMPQANAMFGVYYVVFFACTVYALWLGAARSVTILLIFCGLGFLSMPITGLISLIFSSHNLWLHTSLATLMVDITALVGGLICFYLARKTYQRVNQGEKDSIWAN